LNCYVAITALVFFLFDQHYTLYLLMDPRTAARECRYLQKRIKSIATFAQPLNKNEVLFVKMARPGRLELRTLCLEATQYKTLSAASGVAYEEVRHLSRP
jgi:hypothetical protein